MYLPVDISYPTSFLSLNILYIISIEYLRISFKIENICLRVSSFKFSYDLFIE